jgi:hypothetical protein
MYLTRGGSVQRPLASGPWGWPVVQIPWPVGQVLCRFGSRLRAHVSTREGEGQDGEKVSGCRTTWLTGHMARPVGHHMVSYQLNQVGKPSLDPYKYPSTGGNWNTHHILEIPLVKLLFLVY